MNFTPVPKNDFLDFIDTYFKRAQDFFPAVETAAAKWEFIDLIPGMSDFDTRLIVKNGMTLEDWVKMSDAIGKVHYSIWREHPEWARKLEHTPGVNLTWKEFTSGEYYYPEYQQWTFYCGDKEQFIQAQDSFEKSGWSEEDELYHLKKFLTYLGPYNKNIDPPINMGAFRKKYILHSRMMHYYLPPLQSGLSILSKRTIKGKLQTLLIAKKMFPKLKTTDKIIHAIEDHYEVPLLYQQPFLSKLEDDLKDDLFTVYSELQRSIKVIDPKILPDPGKTKDELKKICYNVQAAIFTSLRFSRLFKGRLFFYTNVDSRFENILLIRNELSRIGDLFLHTPMRLFYLNNYPESTNEKSISEIINIVTNDFFDKEDRNIIKAYYKLTREMPPLGEEDEKAKKIMKIFDDYFICINKLLL